MDNNLNPYQTPAYSGSPHKTIGGPQRNLARTRLRMALMILLVPAAYNYYCFDRTALGGLNAQPDVFMFVSRLINLGGFALVSCLIWFLGLPFLEWVTQIVFWLFSFSRNSLPRDWLAALYQTLRPAVYFALAGAALWMIWNVGYYDLDLEFYAISIPVGILAHILAAGLYLPLAYRWYRIEKTARVHDGG